jgi:hypothetical protein
MHLEKITIHILDTKSGTPVRYARIYYNNGCSVVGQSILLRRLSPQLRRFARRSNGAKGTW